MCFEWDKRYFRELEEKKSKEKLDEMIRNAEDAVNRSRADEAPKERSGEIKENVAT